MKRKKKLLLAAFVFALVLELGLQLAAFAVSFTMPSPPQVEGAQVVCLGDSYTAGIGATSPAHAYPAQLQQQLAARGLSVRVANGGCPGQDSAFLLRQVPALLRSGPRVLCVLMAFNDTWAQPARVAPHELQPTDDYGRFAWRWRTGRLAALCLRFFANSWHRSGDAPPAAGAPAVPLTDVAAGLALLEQLGAIATDDAPPTFAPPPAPELQRRVREVEQQLFVVHGPALQLAEQLATEHPEQAIVQRTLAVAAHLAGAAATCQAALDRLTTMAADDDDAREQLVITLKATARGEQAALVARAHLLRQPRSVVAALVLQDATFQLGRIEEFLPAAERALRLGARLFPAQAAMIARHLAVSIGGDDASRAATLLVAATLLDGNLALTRGKAESLRAVVAWEIVQAAVARAPLSSQALRAPLDAALRDAFTAPIGEAWAATFEHHLLEVGRLCRERGVALVLLGYPFAHAGLERVQRRVAERLGVPFVPVRERFDAALQTRARDELFVPNGHCSDAGYALLAEVAAEVVAARLRD